MPPRSLSTACARRLASASARHSTWLNAQQDLVNARVALVTAQRDRVVASYTVLASTGALSPQILGLRIEVYDPVTHYQQVRDAWGGLRTPSGQ